MNEVNQNKQFKIAIIGECMVELQNHGEMLKQSFGGDTLNTAVYLSRLCQGQNVSVSYITALGQDPFSQEMLNAWKEEGINTEHVMLLKNKMPGLYHIQTDSSGERQFFYWRNDAAAKTMMDQPESAALLDHLKEYDAVYLSGITLAILTEQGREVLFEFLADFQKQGGHVFFDNNYRANLWQDIATAQSVYQRMLILTDTALLTFDDEQQLYGDTELEQCIERTIKSGVTEIAIKRGAQECLVITAVEKRFVAPTPIHNVVDTTAAGDSFSAGYIAKRLGGGSAFDSATMGHRVAGTVIQYQGAVIPKQFTPTL
jgi:2-dehydro-3-deoxygluconokinase